MAQKRKKVNEAQRKRGKGGNRDFAVPTYFPPMWDGATPRREGEKMELQARID